MIKFENVTKIYPGRGDRKEIKALDDISLAVEGSEFLSICGRSGAGKTTLLKMILKEENPTSGKVFFDNEDLSKLRPAKIPWLRKRIGTVFQDYKLFQNKTAYENIAYAMEVMGAKDEEIKRDVDKVLEIVGLANRANNFPRELSGGEKQRVAIARALINRPEVILADEPTGNLDPYNAAEIIKLLMKIYESGTTIILSSHNKDVINKIKKRVITLDEGKIIRDDKEGRFVI
jgi:cell division transport system ATP-binding protein